MTSQGSPYSGECLLAALDADRQRLLAAVDDARDTGDAPAEVLALDALARIAATAGDARAARSLGTAADQRMPSASHAITELDRTDVRALRQPA